MTTHPSPEELHLLYILLDPNLPTGGFIASSGLESYAKHGFIHSSNPSNTKTAEGVVRFAKAEVENYGATTGGFVRDAWGVMDSHLEGRSWKGKAKELGGSTVHEDGRGVQSPDATEAELKVEETVRALQDLDAYHESTLLSHVARRSSKAQGVAMLTLYTRGLSIPSVPGSSFSASASNENTKEARARKVVEGYKRSIRGGKSSGHLAICWGVMTAALALSLDRAIHLHLYLHARSLLSSAVRLNLIGPYASSQLLLHPFRGIIEDAVKSIEEDIQYEKGPKTSVEVAGRDFWDWTERVESGPKTTWPLGEILVGRHDLQHSRIFNS